MFLKDRIKRNKNIYTFFKKTKRYLRRFTPSIRGKNNVIRNNGYLLNVKWDIEGNNNEIEIGEETTLSDMMIYIRGNNHKVNIGNSCKYKGGSIWIEDEYCELVIGQKTTIESAHLALTEPHRKIIIGEDCMLSMNIEFRTGDSHSILNNDTGERINFGKDIILGNHVWIGANCIILKGTTIGENSVIGTQSLVTKNIPNNSIAAGIPAKIVKNNINWSRERINP